MNTPPDTKAITRRQARLRNDTGYDCSHNSKNPYEREYPSRLILETILASQTDQLLSKNFNDLNFSDV